MTGQPRPGWALAGAIGGQGQNVAPRAALGSAAGAAPNRQVGWFDTAVAYFGLVVYCDAVSMPFRILRDAGEHPLPGESDLVVTLCQTMIMGTLAFILINRWRRFLPLMPFLKPFLLIILLCTISTLWSDFPFVTIRRTATLGISVMFGVFLYQTFGLARLCRMFEGLAMALGLLSVALYILVPSIGRDSNIDDYDAVRGLFSQKNMLGECSLFGFVCCAYRLTEQRKIVTFLRSAVPFFAFMQLSHSASAMTIALIVLVVALASALRGHPRVRMAYVYVCASAAVSLVATTIFSPDVIFNAIGRDASLTGRVPLWQVAVGIIAEAPVFGHGYAGYFNADSANIQYLWLEFPWHPPHAHSGYLDMMIDLGIAGLLLYVWMFLSTIVLALRAQFSGTLPTARWVSFFMLVIVLMNIDEDTSMIASLFTALMPSAMLEVGVWNARRKNALARFRPSAGHPDRATYQGSGPRRPPVDPRFWRDGGALPVAAANQGGRSDDAR